MDRTSEKGSSFWGTLITLGIIAAASVYIIHLCQKAINESRAEAILSGTMELAEYEKDKLDEASFDPDRPLSGSIERKGYGFALVEGSTPTLIKIETEKKTITSGVCAIIKKKLKKSMWRDAFQKVVVVDRAGDEKTDILIYDCPNDSIPALRFYVQFEAKEAPETNEVKEEKEKKEPQNEPRPQAYVPSASAQTTRSTTPSYTRQVSCPSGTSENGKGGIATSGCHCINPNEFWSGSSCQQGCPPNSSRKTGGETDQTDVSGCYCNASTPVWSGEKCVQSCPGNRIYDTEQGKCVCPKNMRQKTDGSEVCVECNRTSDCQSGYQCVSNKCIGDEKEYEDCRWGICQLCDGNGTRRNIPDRQPCEVAGLSGECNGNGTCYPTNGRRCSAFKKCPAGEFCNYGGTFNSSKKQKGKFGQTANVCQVVNHQEFTYKGTTYYYNTKKDLKSWCRAANNKANCKWGYLAKPGAESWCASLGKHLLTQAEISAVWDVLKRELPQTYTGYAYWVQEGVWLEDKSGKQSFGKGHPDGYGGRGGVVCK